MMLTLKATCNNSLDLVKPHLVLDCNQTTASLHAGAFDLRKKEKNLMSHHFIVFGKMGKVPTCQNHSCIFQSECTEGKETQLDMIYKVVHCSKMEHLFAAWVQ